MKPLEHFEYIPRNCDICKSNDFELLWEHKYTARTIRYSWEFLLKIVICRHCGFVFVAPVPSAKTLNQYYADTFARYDKQVLEFNEQIRIDFIKRICNRNGIFLEVGSNKKTTFHTNLGRFFKQVFTIEPNESVDSEFKSLKDIPENFADVIACYFVLEHIPNPREFIALCSNALKSDGTIIIEVPDIRLYPQQFNALIAYEHTNHFSQGILTRLLEDSGFELIETDNKFCSRNYGFVAAFRKLGKKKPVRTGYESEYEQNKKSVLKGLIEIKKFERLNDEAYLKLIENSRKGEKTILWCANDSLLRFLNNKLLPEGVTIVDSDPAKKTWSDTLIVNLPSDVKDEITKSKMILIFSKLNSEIILNFIQKEFKKTFEKDYNITVDY